MIGHTIAICISLGQYLGRLRSLPSLHSHSKIPAEISWIQVRCLRLMNSEQLPCQLAIYHRPL
ncbi:hypothetical protein RJ640_004070 [Escallonia rubra]|uniref:Uncharacterized protein n=1 Tax=Escallonia rubra TaxID=112253 RepID=A0AA88UJ99_9ASTE|nr:hypothetical protein RJ640_004070 [Escallonia rubra]